MSATTGRRVPYRQSVSSKIFETNSPTRRHRMEKPTRSKGSSIIKNMGNLNNSYQKAGYENTNHRVVLNTDFIGTVDSEMYPVPFAREMFYDAYSKGLQNISILDCPKCLDGISFFKAPEAYYEIQRLEAVEKYMNKPHWEKVNRFKMLLRKMKQMFKCNGAAISLIDSRHQVIKFQIGYGFDVCSRQVSIDSHTLLSKDFFLIMDASKDWRFQSNPIVKNTPNIKFYLGVPLVTAGGQAIGVLSIFDSLARCDIDESFIDIITKMSSEVMEYLDSTIKAKKYGNGETAATSRDPITGKMLLSTCLPTSKLTPGTNGSQNESVTRLLEIYGRATGDDRMNEEIIFEKDGSGTSYRYNSSFKFTKFSSPYGDLIDLSMWNKLSKCGSFNKASELLCNALMTKLEYDCVYILNVKVTKLCCVKGQLFPSKQREIDFDSFPHQSSIEWIAENTEDQDDFDFGSSKTKLVSLAAKDYELEQGFATGAGYAFHSNAISSENGIGYNSNDNSVLFHSGLGLPFYRFPSKLLRKQKMRGRIDGSRSMELFYKTNGYLICCFSNDNKVIYEREIGYIYGCASILRKLYFHGK